MVIIILINFLSFFPSFGLVISFWVSIFSFFPISNLGHVMATASFSFQNLYIFSRNKLLGEAGFVPSPTQPGITVPLQLGPPTLRTAASPVEAQERPWVWVQHPL